MAINTKLYIETYIKIRDKNAKIVPLKLNTGQQRLYDVIKTQKDAHKPVRVIILKARQIGFSTLTEAIIFKESVTKKNINSGIIAHKDDSTTNLFNMSKLMYNSLPGALKPQRKASNAKEIIFDNSDGTGLNSKIKCMTAGGSGVGRSDTFNNLHISELAFWACNKQDTLAGLLQTVPNNNSSMIIIESTANGYDYFKELWDAATSGENDFVPLFVGWHEMADYQMPYNGFILTDEEIRLKKLFNLTNNQLTWRRWCIANNCGGDTEKFKQEYPIIAEEAFLTTGRSVFDKTKITARITTAPKPIKTGFYDYRDMGLFYQDVNWIDSDGGNIRIYNGPINGMPYVIGADTAGDGNDKFAASVLENINGTQVATISQTSNSDDFIAQLFALGSMYNNALIAPEANFGGNYISNQLSKYGYKNLYYREQIDTISKRPDKKYGFWTSDVSKRAIIEILKSIVNNNISIINDNETLTDMLTYIIDSKGRYNAQDGYHDDTIMALAIAHYIRPQQKDYIDAIPVDFTNKDFSFKVKEDAYGIGDRINVI